ncbi:MAG: MBL fold metallo-hydrolase [Anaerolineales bacterium]|nr:MBL fold metallo-hydrolase [Anaerolineales bacterium]
MEAIADNVYFELQYPGVTLGVISKPRGLIQIDAPPALEDGRAWRATLLSLGGGSERVLITLDSHPDRTLGIRAMDCTVIAQEHTASVFRNRPSTFKAQGEETGAEWELIPGMGSVRWAHPEISFSSSMELYWGDTPVLIEHHPGPTSGSVWVVLPEEKIVFVGDTILKNQPPFLALADLEAWIESLDLLFSPVYKGFTIISGRDGIVADVTIRNQKDLIKNVQKRVGKLINRKVTPEVLEKSIQPLLSQIRFASSLETHYAQRLRYGLQQYIMRHLGTHQQENE